MSDMMSEFAVLPQGDVTSPRGFLAGAAHAGVRADVRRPDLALLYSEAPCAAAAVFTANRVKAAPVLVTQKHLADGRAQAVIVNSGCANAATGERGLHDAWEMAQLAAQKLGIDPYDVVVASTGVIGTFLPMERIRATLAQIELSAESGQAFARAIMTTDTRPKHTAVRFSHNGRQYTVGGVAKGAGMIHPHLATMLSYITTDAPLAQPFLAAGLRQAVDVSFNMIDVDSDTSTNDAVVVLANGLAGGDPITGAHPAAADFQATLSQVCTHLAKAIVADAEGGTKVIEAKVEGAASLADARGAAREVVRSLGVKTAIYGCDPNWGRILAAVGNSGAQMEEDKITLWLGGLCLYQHGWPQPFDERQAKAHLAEREISIRVDLGLGEAAAVAWGSDITEEYVRLNSLYTT